MKFRATSYSLGQIVAEATVEADSYRAALRDPKVKALPAAAQGDRGKIKVIGLKLVRA